MENPLASHDGSHRVVVQEIGLENPDAFGGTLEPLQMGRLLVT